MEGDSGSRSGSGVSRRRSRPASALSSSSAAGARPESSKSAKSVNSAKSGASVSFSDSRPGSGVQELVEDPWATDQDDVFTSQWQTNEQYEVPEEEEFTSLASVPSEKDDTEVLISEDNVEQPRGCWAVFQRCFGGMWATNAMNVKQNDREVYVRTTIRELVVYCIFISILCILTFGMTSPQMYYYTNILETLFKEGKEVNDHESFWKFMESSYMDSLYWEYKYNDGSETNFICPGGTSSGPCPVAPSDRNILYENRLLGVPRLRQLRVFNGSCELHADIQKLTSWCFDSYSKKKEDTEPFGLQSVLWDNSTTNATIMNATFTSENAWQYQNEEVVNGVPYTALLATYSGGGYIQDLHSERNESIEIIKELKEGLWIGRGTRFVSIDFTVYNANLNYFCIIKIVFEFPPTGGVVPSFGFQTVKLLRYVTPFDYFVMACEIVYIGFIFYYMAEELIEISKNRIRYFKTVWNVLDVVVIGVSCAMIFFVLMSILEVEDKIGTLLSKPDEFADFTYLGSLARTIDSAMAVNIFFAWIKFLKYISFNKTMTQLTKTLTRCAKDVAGFGLMFFIIFFAFAQVGYMIFGSRMKDYSSLTDAVFSLLRIILGDFDFNEMKATEPYLGPAYFLGYVMIVFFILINMFLAIINDTYAEVKAEIAARKVTYNIGDYFARGYNNLVGNFAERDRAIDLENALKLANDDGKITFDEIRQNLKKANFSNVEIEIFFAKYDTDGQGITAEEAEDIFDDLEDGDFEEKMNEGEKEWLEDVEEPQGGTVEMHQILDLGDKVDAIEAQFANIVAKIEGVFERMDRVQSGKAKKRAAMDKFFPGE